MFSRVGLNVVPPLPRTKPGPSSILNIGTKRRRRLKRGHRKSATPHTSGAERGQGKAILHTLPVAEMAESGTFCLHHRVQTGSGAHLTFYQMGTGTKRPGREADHSNHSLTSSAEVMNV
jgi:hypothetical protein